MEVYTLGLSEILIGAVTQTGDMPALNTMTKIGEVLENTASFTQEEATFTEFKEEGNSTAKVRVQSGGGGFNFIFQIMNVNPALLAKYVGGTVTNGVWSFMGSTITMEESMYIKPKQGLYFQMPKASISATIGGELNAENLVTATFNVSPLSPAANKPSLLSGKISDLEVPAG